MTKKIPPLNEIAKRVARTPGAGCEMNKEAARAARQDVMLYLGAACAGLVHFSPRGWFDVRMPHFDLPIGFDAMKAWMKVDPEVRELKAFLAGGPKTPLVEKWIAAGTKAWR